MAEYRMTVATWMSFTVEADRNEEAMDKAQELLKNRRITTDYGEINECFREAFVDADRRDLNVFINDVEE